MRIVVAVTTDGARLIAHTPMDRAEGLLAHENVEISIAPAPTASKTPGSDQLATLTR